MRSHDRILAWARGYLSHHTVTENSTPTAIHLADQKGGDRMSFILFGDFLCVLNLACATYKFNEEIDLRILEGCTFNYMLRKCVSSPIGSTFSRWSTEVAEEWVEEKLLTTDYDKELKVLHTLRGKDKVEGDFLCAASVLDWESMEEYSQAGMAPHYDYYLHFVGLQKAVGHFLRGQNEPGTERRNEHEDQHSGRSSAAMSAKRGQELLTGGAGTEQG